MFGPLVTFYPNAFIIGMVMITAAASTGFIVLEEKKDGLKLWQLKDSEFEKNTEWIRDTFPSKTRFSPILILAHTGTKCSQSSSGERNLLQSEGHPKYH